MGDLYSVSFLAPVTKIKAFLGKLARDETVRVLTFGIVHRSATYLCVSPQELRGTQNGHPGTLGELNSGTLLNVVRKEGFFKNDMYPFYTLLFILYISIFYIYCIFYIFCIFCI